MLFASLGIIGNSHFPIKLPNPQARILFNSGLPMQTSPYEIMFYSSMGLLLSMIKGNKETKTKKDSQEIFQGPKAKYRRIHTIQFCFVCLFFFSKVHVYILIQLKEWTEKLQGLIKIKVFFFSFFLLILQNLGLFFIVSICCMYSWHKLI